MTIDFEIRESIDKMLHRSGMWTEGWKIEPLPCGGNNRVFQLNSSDSKLLLKMYFYHPSDPRNRLSTEFKFSEFVWNKGIHSLPRPVIADYSNHLGLYEFVPGTKILSSEINADVIKIAVQFIVDINQYRQDALLIEITNASEACFSIADHIECVTRRVHRLDKLLMESAVDREAVDFITTELQPLWQLILDNILNKLRECHINMYESIKGSEKCLSPSDFGFHNALLQEDGTIKFLDFEYAGWDDPCKLICDFFCQIAVPVNMDYFELFAKTLLSKLGYSDAYYDRTLLLLPLYQVKWCCIVLNHFIEVDSKRRSFAGNLINEEQKAEQLDKARQIVRCIREDFGYGE